MILVRNFHLAYFALKLVERFWNAWNVVLEVLAVLPDLTNEVIVLGGNILLQGLQEISALFLQRLCIFQNLTTLLWKRKQFATILTNGEGTIDKVLYFLALRHHCFNGQLLQGFYDLLAGCYLIVQLSLPGRMTVERCFPFLVLSFSLLKLRKDFTVLGPLITR